MPAYIVTVLIAYLVFHLRPVEPNPGHSWAGLWRHLTLTQIYSGDYVVAWLVLMHTTDWLPRGAGLWLPHYLVWFVGGMVLALLTTTGVTCPAFLALPLAVVSYLIVSTPIAGVVTAPAPDPVRRPGQDTVLRSGRHPRRGAAGTELTRPPRLV